MSNRRRNVDYVYGLYPVAEALRGRREHRRLLVRRDRLDDRRITELVELANQSRLRIEQVDQVRLDSFSDGGNHQGVVLETGPFRYVDLDTMIAAAESRPILILDRLQDPQNLATLIRTAAAVDVAGIVIQRDRSVNVTPAVVRSSAGLVERVSIARENNTRRCIETLKKSGYWAIALEDTDGAESMFTADIPEPVALVVGSEERGISPNVVKACDLVVNLPMPGNVDSLNAAVAGSVALFELVRRMESMDK